MSKSKPNSIPTSVEAQIRTRARNLPIYKCYINIDWQEKQTAAILIIRKHTNGNITIGNYLVDLKLRGVKDCYYMFNESPLKIEESIKRYPEIHQECDYNLAHNIIHAGLEFAADYGFEPHKNFKTAQYILEEDTEDIPLIEIPLGDDGVPVLEICYGDSGQSEIARLQKSAGDNFHIVYFDKDGKPITTEQTYQEVVDEIMKTGLQDFLDKRGSELKTFREWQVFNDMVYIHEFYSEEEQTQIDEEVDLILKDPRLLMKDDNSENTYEKELALPVKYFEEGKTDMAYAETRKVIDKYPDDPMLWNILLYNLSVDSKEVDEESVKEAYSRFPEHPLIKAWYGEWLAQNDRADEVITLFNHLPGLDALTTENIPIAVGALPSFCFAYAQAWLQKEDIRCAEPYYQVIIKMDVDYRLGTKIQETMAEMKRKRIDEIIVDREEKEALLSENGH